MRAGVFRTLFPAPTLLALTSATASPAAEFYVAPMGSPSDNGSIGNPWDLQTARNQPSSLHPGDTIWLRGGTYAGTFLSDLTGTSTSPIVVRQCAGEASSVPVAGTYYVWCRVLAPDAVRDSFFVTPPGQPEDVYDDAEGTWSAVWQWTLLHGRNGTGQPLTLDPRTVTLTSETNPLSFRGREIDSKIDRILITSDPNFVPNEGVTTGCGSGNYCPNSPNTRAQMAAFLVRTFQLR